MMLDKENRSMPKVSFMVIGVQKCGTSSLAYQLEQHPNVEFCRHKEPDFFSKSKDWRNELDAYHGLYNKDAEKKVLGEASTTYSWLLEYPETVDRLFEYNPELKLVFMIRNPIDRIRSHFGHEFSKGRVSRPIEEEAVMNPTYLHHSLYAAQIKPFIDKFGADRIHYVKFESFVADGSKDFEKVLDFLGLSPLSLSSIDTSPKNEILKRKAERPLKRILAPCVRFLPQNLRAAFKGPFEYKMKEKPMLSDEMRKRLWYMVESDLLAFEQISGLDLSDYKLKEGR